MLSYFATLPDPRIDRCKKHLLSDIIFITLAAVICGADDWNEIEDFGKAKEVWLREHCTLSNGIPTHDTFNRVFAAIDTQVFEQCFMNWVKDIAKLSEGELVCIDGKRMANSGINGSKAIVHMVSAWASENRLALAQKKVDDKSNEITAIPALLDILELKGCVVSIDAMGTQKDIASKIIEKEADYILALKENQETLFAEANNAFSKAGCEQLSVEVDTGHGRIEKRNCAVFTDMDWISESEHWKGMQTIIRVDAERTDKQTLKTTYEQRFYISSLKASPQTLNTYIRNHWAIENQLHWSLDVDFKEDQSTKRAGNAAQNFSIITKIVLNILKNFEDSKGKQKVSLKNKRKKAGWNHDYLLNIMMNAKFS